jgi:hypothetical protein
MTAVPGRIQTLNQLVLKCFCLSQNDVRADFYDILINNTFKPCSVFAALLYSILLMLPRDVQQKTASENI